MTEAQTEPVMVTCPECDGDGEYETDCYACGGMTMESCGECDGTGEIESTDE